MTPPCGVPACCALPPVIAASRPRPVSSTGAFSHILIRRSIVPIDDPPGDALHQLAVRDGVEVLAQIGVDHIGVALAEQLMHRLDRIAARLRPGR